MILSKFWSGYDPQNLFVLFFGTTFDFTSALECVRIRKYHLYVLPYPYVLRLGYEPEVSWSCHSAVDRTAAMAKISLINPPMLPSNAMLCILALLPLTESSARPPLADALADARILEPVAVALVRDQA